MVLNIKTALEECNDHVADIRHRNGTLIDFYIYPNPVPTHIAAYDPRLATLQSRIKSIKKLNFSQLEQLIDDPDVIAAIHLRLVIGDVLNAIVGYKTLFELRYDPTLSQRAPFASTFAALEDLEKNLQDLIRIRQSNSARPRAEQLVANNHHSSSRSYSFCPGGIQVLNGTDRGSIASVSEKVLLRSNRETLSTQGGAFLWWKCPVNSCTFKLRFHILGSQASSIHNNSEIRSHPSIPLEYRSTFLIKSHLHCTAFASEGGAAKYGCLICFAEGRPLEGGVSAFTTGRELATHICGAHKGSKTPAAMVLEKIKVAVRGQCPVGVKRWDANLLTN